MENQKKLKRVNSKNNLVIFNVLKNDEIIISLKKVNVQDDDEHSNNLNGLKIGNKLKNEIFWKLEKIYRFSLNDKDFQTRGLKYIENNLHL